MIKKIVELKVLENYRVFLKYDDDLEGEINLSHLLNKDEFSFIKNYDEFSKISIHPTSNDLYWKDTIADHLCKNALRKQIELRNLAKRLKLAVD